MSAPRQVLRSGVRHTLRMPVPPLMSQQWFTSWTLDLSWTAMLAGAALIYMLASRRVGSWPVARTIAFLVGLGSVLLVKSCFLAVYSHTLFWVLAVQDVLLLTVVPVPLVLGRAGELLRAALPGASGLRLPIPAMLGSLIGMSTLLSLYMSGWDQARLERPWLFALTDLVLLLAGCTFLGSLLSEGGSSYGIRALVALIDGLDAMPGLAVLGTHSVIARSWYAAQARTWGPTLARDQYIGGSAMIALSELVGLPVLLILLVRWVRADAFEARGVDAQLDIVDGAELAAAGLTTDNSMVGQPWWEHDAGPLADRATREGWKQR
jgi:cytochrome c oxidase assembly factor CtaG